MTNLSDSIDAIEREHPLVREVREYLRQVGLPGHDLNDLPSSQGRFTDGGSFRIEIPTINSVQACVTALEESKHLGIHINRITETTGIFRHLKREITEWVRVCDEYGCELVMSPGPRAIYDTSATAQTPQGSKMGYRLRGQEQLVRAIVDIRRAIEVGVRGFLVYDEGMLSVLGQMRKDGKIPAEVRFKVSAHCGHGNAASAQLLWKLGANSFNPVRDLQPSMMAALRAAVPMPLDIHTDNPPSSGGFIRTYEAPEIVRVASPVYLKTGNSVLAAHGHASTPDEAKRMVRQAAIVVEMMEEFAPHLKQSKSANGQPTLG